MIRAAGAGFLAIVFCYHLIAREQPFGDWGAPVNLDAVYDPTRGVNTGSNDGCPIESPDGQMLFLASNRDGTRGFNDIWIAVRSSDGLSWEDPVNAEEINSGAQDFCPSPLPGHRLLFVSTRANNCGGSSNNADIYQTQWHPAHGWLEPQPLGCSVNSGLDEFSPSLVETDGVTMLFFSRGPSINAHRIFMTTLQSDGTWAEATPVDELNAGPSDARPNVRKDGLEIVFDSTRGGPNPQIYSATRPTIFDPWSVPQPLPWPINSDDSQQTRASLSRDGTRLYFGSNRLGEGSFDIYVATRSGPGSKRQ